VLRFIKGQRAISPGMAVRLFYSSGRSPERRLRMQGRYDLRQAEQAIDSEPLITPV